MEGESFSNFKPRDMSPEAHRDRVDEIDKNKMKKLEEENKNLRERLKKGNDPWSSSEEYFEESIEENLEK